MIVVEGMKEGCVVVAGGPGSQCDEARVCGSGIGNGEMPDHGRGGRDSGSWRCSGRERQ